MSLKEFKKITCKPNKDSMKVTLHYQEGKSIAENSMYSLFRVNDHYVLMKLIKPVEVFQTFREFENFLKRKYGEIPIEVNK